MPSTQGEPTELIAVRVPLSLHARIEAVGGETFSDKCRTCMGLGAEVAIDPDFMRSINIAHQIDRLHDAAATIAALAAPTSQPVSTAGAAWVNDTAEAAAAMAAGHALVASPGAVALQGQDAEGLPGIFIADLEAGRLTLHSSSGEVALELDGRTAASLLDALAAGIAEARRRAAKGSIEKLEITSREGIVQWITHGPNGPGVRVGKVAIHWPGTLYPLLAELCALQGRWLSAKAAQLGQLEQGLAATPAAEQQEVIR